MNTKVVAVLPARLDSKRFSGKVLYQYLGKPLLYYVWKAVRRSKEIDRLLVATDNKLVAETAAGFGAEVIMTSKRHRTGSDRVAEVMKGTRGAIWVNIQADNLGVSAGALDRVIRHMKADPNCLYATMARRIEKDDDLFDPNVVKVVTAPDGRALWFSRYPIPYLRKATDSERSGQHKFFEHIGIYFYRRRALAAYALWKRSTAEKAESLEQLRILENGGSMQVFNTKMAVVSIDTPKDLEKTKRL